MERSELIAALREAGKGKRYLTYEQFLRAPGITKRKIFKHFDSWSEACIAAGIQAGPTRPKLQPPPMISAEDCIAEMRRVANLVGGSVLSRSVFEKHAIFSTRPVIGRFGSWRAALQAAGLKLSKQHHDAIPFEQLATDFLTAFLELKRIPALQQVVRRSRHGEYCFSMKFGGYPAFKQLAVSHLLETSPAIAPELKEVLLRERSRLQSCAPGKTKQVPAAPHHKGRILGFRAFAYAPTYEQEVVSLFGAVAEELGFEILSTREAFPDCLARRRIDRRRSRYGECRIEFELRSRDYQTHGHPLHGCDLIVCWEHNWNDCPVEVLELRTAIESLPGWK